MTDDTPMGIKLLGALSTESDGTGTVKVAHRFNAEKVDVWSALTDPSRLVQWIGEVQGELHLGGEFRTHFIASGSVGIGRVVACEVLRRLVVVLDPGKPNEAVIEIDTIGENGGTRLLVEQRGIALARLAAHGAGIQIHVEDLASHLAGRGPCDADTRWDELQSAHEAQVAAGTT